MTSKKPSKRDQGSSSPKTTGAAAVAAPAPPAAGATDALNVEADGLRYELDQAPSRNGSKVVLTVRSATGGEKPPFLDRVDLYAFRSRIGFASVAADAFGKTTDQVLGHLAVLLDQVERAAAAERKPDTVLLTPARRARLKSSSEAHTSSGSRCRRSRAWATSARRRTRPSST